jgi:hypothetical protein
LYVAAIRSYFAYHDIDVIPARFKRKVRIPKLYREDEQPIDEQPTTYAETVGTYHVTKLKSSHRRREKLESVGVFRQKSE